MIAAVSVAAPRSLSATTVVAILGRAVCAGHGSVACRDFRRSLSVLWSVRPRDASTVAMAMARLHDTLRRGSPHRARCRLVIKHLARITYRQDLAEMGEEMHADDHGVPEHCEQCKRVAERRAEEGL